jgi:serine O-acetyltransferase
MSLLNCLKEDLNSYNKKDNSSLFNVFIKFFLVASFRAVVLYRLSNYFDNRLSIISILLEKLMHITTITWIGRKAVIGSGFVIRHVGGIVIGGKTQIGINCEIRQGVTLGGNLGKEKYGTTQPILGNNIMIGAGAKILGPVKIGDNSIIGANAVVISDIPKDSVAGGVPARVLRKVRDNENPLTITEFNN